MTGKPIDYPCRHHVPRITRPYRQAARRHPLHPYRRLGEGGPLASREEAYERAMLNAMRSLSVELLKRGVTTAIIEGAYMIWWLHSPA